MSPDERDQFLTLGQVTMRLGAAAEELASGLSPNLVPIHRERSAIGELCREFEHLGKAPSDLPGKLAGDGFERRADVVSLGYLDRHRTQQRFEREFDGLLTEAERVGPPKFAVGTLGIAKARLASTQLIFGQVPEIHSSRTSPSRAPGLSCQYAAPSAGVMRRAPRARSFRESRSSVP